MAVMKKIAGLVAGVSAVAVIGAAVAQGIPPNPFVTNHALGAGRRQECRHDSPEDREASKRDAARGRLGGSGAILPRGRCIGSLHRVLQSVAGRRW